MSGDSIHYGGHRIDERSQIIIQLLRDLPEATAGKLRSEAGLDDTSSVHHRVREHLGPSAAGLVAQTGTVERPGRQPDEIVYGLTEEGVDFAVAHANDLTDAVAAAEAVETLRRIRATVENFEARVEDVEDSVDDMDEWKNRWSTRVGRVEDEVEEVVEKRLGQHVTALNEDRSRIDDLASRVDDIESAVSELGERLDGANSRVEEVDAAVSNRPTYQESLNEMQKLEERLLAVEEELDDVRETAEGVFGGRI